MIAAIYAIHKAGAAYVPLDPTYPEARLTMVMADAKPTLVLIGTGATPKLGDSTARRLSLDEIFAPSSSLVERGLRIGSSAQHLSHLIYTSGSTGTPKGVAISHRALTAMLIWAGSEFEADQWRGVLASTSICFDLSLFEIYGPLSRGGKLILVENALGLSGISCRDEVTLINTVPSVMAELVKNKALPMGLATVKPSRRGFEAQPGG